MRGRRLTDSSPKCPRVPPWVITRWVSTRQLGPSTALRQLSIQPNRRNSTSASRPESRLGARTWIDFAAASLARNNTSAKQPRSPKGEISPDKRLRLPRSSQETRPYSFATRPLGLKTLDLALKRHPLSGISVVDRPYTSLAIAYAIVGQPAIARRYIAENEANTPAILRKNSNARNWAAGYLALAENRGRDAITAFQRARDEGSCTNCALFELGQSYEMANLPDSALIGLHQRGRNPARRQ